MEAREMHILKELVGLLVGMKRVKWSERVYIPCQRNKTFQRRVHRQQQHLLFSPVSRFPF